MANATTILWMAEFRSWYDGLSADRRAALDYSLALVAEHGPMLAMPHAKKVKGATESIIELRVQTRAFAIRAFYAFNPRREAIMILGGDKKGVADENTWTAAMAKRAGKTWDAYLRANRWRR